MSKYNNLKTAIRQAIKSNGNQEITGDLLQIALLAVMTSLGKGFQFYGVLHPEDSAQVGDENMFFILFEPGVYGSLNGFSLSQNEIAVVTWNGVWNIIKFSFDSSVIQPLVLQETQRATGVERDLQAQITGNRSDLVGAINQETQRATQAEASIRQDVADLDTILRNELHQVQRDLQGEIDKKQKTLTDTDGSYGQRVKSLETNSATKSELPNRIQNSLIDSLEE